MGKSFEIGVKLPVDLFRLSKWKVLTKKAKNDFVKRKYNRILNKINYSGRNLYIQT